jgi:hypothetical protein
LIYNKIDMCNLVTKNLRGRAKSAFFAPIFVKNLLKKIFFTRKKVFLRSDPPQKTVTKLQS